MADVAHPAVAHAGTAGVRQPLTGTASIAFVPSDAAADPDGPKEADDGVDPWNASSNKRARRARHGDAANEENGDAENDERTNRRRAVEKRDDASSDDDTTAPWFDAFVRRCEAKDGKGDDHDRMVMGGGRARASRTSSSLGFSVSPPPEGSEFTTNWFTHNQPKLLRVFEDLGWAGATGATPRNVLEIGCWEGRSTQWLLTTLCRHRESKLTCVDTWEGGIQYQGIGLDLDDDNHTADAVEKRFDANVSLVTGVDPGSESPVNPVRKLKGRSISMLSRLALECDGDANKKYDVAYVDGSHYARDVMTDGVICWEVLKRGGVMVG